MERTVQKVLFSSASGDWSTPDEIFIPLHAEFRFDLDACATRENYKVPRYFSIDGSGIAQDALAQDWANYGKSIWCNPPYGRGIINWIRKAYEASQNGATVVCLLPARTDTQWFWSFILDKAEIRLIKGRLRFGNAENVAPFPSMICIFRPTGENKNDNNSTQPRITSSPSRD